MGALINCNQHSLFGGFSDDDLCRVESLFELRAFGIQEHLFDEGSPVDSIYFLIEGSVRVCRCEKELIIFKTGDSFGEMEMLDTKPAAATVISLEAVKTACLGHRGLYGLYKLDTKLYSIFMMNLARDLARRLRRMDEIMIPEYIKC